MAVRRIAVAAATKIDRWHIGKIGPTAPFGYDAGRRTAGATDVDNVLPGFQNDGCEQ